MTAGSDRANGIRKSRATNISLVNQRHLVSFTMSSFEERSVCLLLRTKLFFLSRCPFYLRTSRLGVKERRKVAVHRRALGPRLYQGHRHHLLLYTLYISLGYWSDEGRLPMLHNY